MTEKRQIDAWRYTFLYKCMFGQVFLVIGIPALVAAWVWPDYWRSARNLGIGFTVGGLWLVCAGLRLKYVAMDDEYVHIGSLFRTIRVPWSEVAQIDERLFIAPRTIRITFKSRTEFGMSIVFIPDKPSGVFRAHPLVAELQERVRRGQEGDSTS